MGMNLYNPQQEDINYLKQLLASGELTNEQLSGMPMNGSFEDAPQAPQSPNMLRQLIQPQAGNNQWDMIPRGTGVVQTTNQDGTVNKPINFGSAAAPQQAERDFSQAQIDIPGVGRGYYGKDGQMYGPDGKRYYQPQERQRMAENSMAEQDRQMKIDKFNSDLAHVGAQTNLSNARLKELQSPSASSGAVTMTEVIDPKDPSRLLRVDARAYKGGSIGDMGVLGASGKEPTSAKREETANNGRDGLAADLQLMRDQYAKLDEAKAIPSTKNSGMGNAVARLQSSGLGQFAGGTFGTEEQAARNEIQATKRRLLSSIKNITGASAQEMNSNVELKTWMDSLGDSNKILESNLGILDAIENKYINAKDYKRRASDAPKANDSASKEQRYQEWKRKQGL